MTAAELRAWIRREGLSHRAAAELLGMSLDGLRSNLYGRRPIGARTQRIVELSTELGTRLSPGQNQPPNT